MKKSLFFLASLPLLASCASDELVDTSVPSLNGNGAATISFTTNQKNITRAYSPLEEADHYNFGVFAYKSTDLVNPVMPNYLVGYYSVEQGYQKSGTTVGDPLGQVDGQSFWMYEGMGNAEYFGTYAGNAITDAFKSNNANQYLKYWDNSAATTAFYAYAPYINNGVKSTVTYVDGTAQSATGNDTYTMCFPNGTIEAGMDNPALSEYMYAYTKVPKSEYGHDVALQFTRLNAKVNIKFWEDIPGYKVRILDLGGNKNYEGVQAAASIKETGQGDFGYRGGKFYAKNGVKINFAGATPAMKQFVGTTQTNSEPLVFKAPTDAQIGENRYTASASASTYYAIPKGRGNNVLAGTSTDFSDEGAAEDADFAKTGFTFHVSYELTAEDTGEKIVVNNATVHVPCTYANWAPNTHYTYIFKITKNSNGTTSGDKDPGTDPSNPDTNINPTDPEVPETQALYPIIFDNCTVVDWEENVTEWNISDAADVIYHDVQLFADATHTTSLSSIVSGDIYVNVTDKDTYASHAIKWENIAVTGPAGADMTKVTYSSTDKKITVAAGAAAGVYTVTYTCPATGDQTTHPSTWTEKFVVGNVYTVALNQYEVGTNGLADSKLTITPKKDNVASEPVNTASVKYLYIDYPANFTAAQKQNVYVETTAAAGSDPYKAEVVVKKEATPGVYKLVYTVDEGSLVKVAEKTFVVKDYSFALSHSVVYLGASPVVVNATVPEATGVISMATTPGITVDNSAKTISVANTTAETETETGYTVTYTLFSGVSQVQYQQSFNVRNTHSVAVAKTSISKSVGTSQATDYSTDVNTIKTTFNGDATSTDLSAKLAILKSDKTATTAGDFKITYTSTNEYKLEVKNGAAAGDYYVEFKSTVAGADKAEYVHFVVTE